MKTFVFQGDSITDANRNRDWDGSMGQGYPNLVAADIGLKRPGEFNFINKGVSGDKSANMYSRIKDDTIAYRPDYLTILIGVNDMWHPLSSGDMTGAISEERYTQLLTMFVEDVLAVKKETTIAIIEPFILKGSGTEEYYDAFRSGVEARAKAAKAVAEKYNCVFIPLQEEFDSKLEIQPSSYWLADGVHPTLAGHRIIANAIINALEL